MLNPVILATQEDQKGLPGMQSKLKTNLGNLMSPCLKMQNAKGVRALTYKQEGLKFTPQCPTKQNKNQLVACLPNTIETLGSTPNTA